jgi:hypothetical protein
VSGFSRTIPEENMRFTAAAMVPLVTSALVIAGTPLGAQWLNNPTAGVPRTADGKVNMTAPAPRLGDGKPDLSGIWMTAEPNRGNGRGTPPPAQVPDEAGDQRNITASRQMKDIGVDLPGGLPYQPWVIPIVKERTANEAIDDPHIRCLPDNFLRAYGLPHLLKFVHSPQLLVVLNEMNAGYRQVFTDGRPLPVDPNPTWQGYSSAKWTGDTLVIDTIGLRDDTWIDWNGSVLTEAAKVREEIRRPDFGHLDIKVTVDDPKAYTKPWTVTLKQRIVVDTELIDEICLENEKFETFVGNLRK